MNEQNYLPLAYLNAWEYCPRRFYLEYELGETADNEHIIIGRHLHRNINQEGKYIEGDTIIYRQQWVWCDRLLINGIIDAVEQRDNQLIPLEYKKGRMNNHSCDHFQLCGAALCLEERTGKIITQGEIFYHANRRRELVFFTDKLRKDTEEAIAAARESLKKNIPAPIDSSQKCRDCSLKNICLPKEVKKLRSEV